MRLMRRVPARMPVALALLVAMIAAGCGASSLPDRETETAAQAAEAPPTTEAAGL